jgi:hypothetical protein
MRIVQEKKTAKGKKAINEKKVGCIVARLGNIIA